MTATEDLLIIVNAKTVTNLIPASSITIVNERGNRVSTAKFTIENGASLSLAQWQTVLIYSTDMVTVHFNGFVTGMSTTKRGVQVDYDIDCSSVEVLLQRAIINGNFIGTDGVIIGNMLTGAYPDLSDFFDWSSGITPLLTSDISMDFQDTNLLDALESLAKRAGDAQYSQGYNDAARINLIKNPALTEGMGFYGGTLVTGSFWQTGAGATWDDNNVAWGAGFGETGGGIRVTSQNISGGNIGYMRIGRIDNTGDLPYKIDFPNGTWLAFRFRCKMTSVSAKFNLRMEAITYNYDGTLYHDGLDMISNENLISSGSWQSITGLYFNFSNSILVPYGAAEIPPSGWIEFELRIIPTASETFTFDLDNVLMETIVDVPLSFPVVGSYFDGNTADAYWLGTSNASASALGSNPLNWGTNPDADFDVDIDNMTQTLENLDINFNGFNGINALIVTGGFQWTDVDWIYPNNGNTVSTHFDLEVSVFPAETFTQPLIYTNIGSDVTPNWSGKTVVTRQTGFAGGNVLYDLEDHWVEFQDPPPDLELSFRVVGRIKQRIRTTIQNEENIDSTGLELADNYYNDTITTPSDAFDLGQTELARRAPSATVEFDTYEPGLMAGDEIDIVDSYQGFSETLVIERVTRAYLGGGYGKFHVECGKYIDGLDDILHSVNNNDEPKVPLGDDSVSLTLRILTDDDGLTLTDDDGLILADIGP